MASTEIKPLSIVPPTAGAPRLGVDPLERVFLAENHDAAYYTWREAGVRGRTLLHIDAHHDMWRMDAKSGITIANFVSAALQDHMVAAVIWVVPDPAWENRGPILRHAAALSRSSKRSPAPVRVSDEAISTTVREKSLTVVPLSRLPAIDEPVLLDIDIDFMVIPRVVYGKDDQHTKLPWCWPEELIASLAGCRIRSDLVTVVHSVEGGYTPLRWKYLGEELLLRLKNRDEAAPEIEGLRLMREGSVAEAASDREAAESCFTQAAQHLPKAAAPRYRMACLCASGGQIELARQWYRTARELDSSYGTPWGSAGFLHLDSRDWMAAEREFAWTLQLDPHDPYATLGLAHVAAKRRRWLDAKRLVEASLAVDPNLLDGYRLLGQVLSKLQRNDEALAAYEHSLKLALVGHKSITATTYTCTAQPRLFDPGYSRTMGEIGGLYEKRGELARAAQFYQMSAAGGGEHAGIRLRLARVYARQRQAAKTLAELGAAVRCTWRLMARRLDREWRRIQEWETHPGVLLTSSKARRFVQDK